MPAEAVTVAVRPAGAKLATDWITTHNGGPDFVLIDDNQGQEPDKQWIAIDANRNSPNFNTIYAMFVTFSLAGKMSHAYVSTANARPDGTQSDWTTPHRLPSDHASAV